MRKKYKLKKEFKRLLILFLGMALATQLVGNSVVFAMNDASDVIATYEVGVEGNNVLATLTKDGTITLSGSGDTKDYTSDTMPFQDNISNIKDIVIEEGVTSIGNAMFYNCKDINGKLIIPSTVVEIGDYAFAGDAYDLAPKITKIENSFTQSNIVVETPVEKKSEESTTEKSAEEQTTPATEEPTADTAQQDATPKQEEQPVQETVKTVKTITEQQIGQSVFVSGQNGGYSCAETNKSFIDAVKEAGYVRADRFVLVRMDSSITQEVPVINGQLVLPSKPDTLGVPAEDALTSYQFAGWTVEGSDNVLNPKDNYSISDGVEELNLTSQWQQTWKINPQVKTEAKEEASIYSAVDRNTGNVLENVNGYIMTVQWQINTKDKDDEESWKNIENATSFTYERKAETGDTKSYFRAKVSITKQSRLRSTPQTEIMTTEAVSGVNATNPITVTYDSNGGAGTIANKEAKDGENYKPEENIFTRTDGKVFTGWKVTLNGVTAKKNDESVVNTNEIVQSHDVLIFTLVGGSTGSVTFTAQWDDAHIVYVDSTVSASGDGLTAANAFKTIQEAYDSLPADGTMYTNKIIFCNGYTFSGNTYLGTKAATMTSLDENNRITINTGITNNSGSLRAQADIRLQDIILSSSRKSYSHQEKEAFYMYGHHLIVGDNVSTINKISIYGGGYENTTFSSTNIEIYSGNWSRVYGGTFSGTISGDVNISVFGGSVDIVYSGCAYASENINYNGTIQGSTNVFVYGGNVSAYIGQRGGKINGDNHNYGNKLEVYGGTVGSILGGPTQPNYANTAKKTIIRIYAAEVGYINGGAGDSSTKVGQSNGVLIEIHEDAHVKGDIFLGSNDNMVSSTTGATLIGEKRLEIYGGKIDGNIFGGCNRGVTNGGDVYINIHKGIIHQNVYGGGNGESNRTASVTGDIFINIKKEAIIEQNVYGGANLKGNIEGNTNISVEGKVKNVYGGGYSSNSNVSGNTTINTYTTANVLGDIFGGGESGKVTGVTNITMNGGNIGGNVYGAGNNADVLKSNT